jgi:hypothetical protein
MKLLNQLIVVAAYSYAQEGSGSNSQDEEGRVDKAYHFLFLNIIFISVLLYLWFPLDFLKNIQNLSLFS